MEMMNIRTWGNKELKTIENIIIAKWQEPWCCGNDDGDKDEN